MYERIPNLVTTDRFHAPEYVVERCELGPDRFFVFKFTVAGRGKFPFDMLRHDQAHPRDPSSALALGHDDPRAITLVVVAPDKHWLPTFDRWRSFGWPVISDASDAS